MVLFVFSLTEKVKMTNMQNICTHTVLKLKVSFITV